MHSRQSVVGLAVFGLIASPAALYFGTGLHPIWWLAWIAPIPVLLFASRASWRETFAVAALAWAIGDLNQWHYLHHVIEIPLVPTLLITILPGLIFAGDVLLYRRFLRTSTWRAALIVPSIWVFYEFVSESLSPHSTGGNISYSQMKFLPILQLASVTGIWGISFCLFLFASTVSVLLSGKQTKQSKLKLGTAAGLGFAIVLGFGSWRLHFTPLLRNTVEVGLLASDVRQNILTEQHADTIRLMRDYAAEAEKLALQGAKVVVIPEKIAVVLDSDLPEIDPLFTSVAAKTGASMVVGVIHPTPGGKWNEARLYVPDGTVRTYDKHHMLPSFESSFRPGIHRSVWQEPSGKWGITICKDMDFPGLSREYGNEGVGLLLVPAWDFDVDGWQHASMAILRGVESGFSMARAPKQGILTATDDRGRILAERVTTPAEPFTSLLARVPVGHDDTFYARFGDWFGWTDIGLALLLMATGMQRSRSSAMATRKLEDAPVVSP
jgi:apolipoprotein N-acyltransferase